MAKKKLKVFKFFCSVCKQHFTFHAQSEQDALKEFGRCGHTNEKTRRLKKGLVGHYKSLAQAQVEQTEAAIARESRSP